MTQNETIANSVANLVDVQSNIKAALASANRAKSAVALMAVTKRFDADGVQPVLEAGHRCFGENRVQEAQGKWPALREIYSDIRLHLIGPLQSNKAEDAVQLFDVIETLDREKLGAVLVKAMEKTGKRPDILVQVNTGEEPQKAGVAPQDAATFIAKMRDELGLPIKGVMCIPPADDYSATHFALLKKIADAADLKVVSMGMSGDYEMACQLGATHVRVGSGIFGARL